MIAVVLAAVALVVSLTIPGPPGPAGEDGTDGATGPTGPQGPAGPGSIVAVNNLTLFPQQVMVAGCNNFVGANVTIDVTGPGRVVVWATVRFSLSHTTGTTDLLWIFLKESTTDCSLTDGTTTLRYNDAEPTQTYFETTTVIDSFAVPAAGSETYFVNARMVLGALDTSDFLESAYIVAVFYPA